MSNIYKGEMQDYEGNTIYPHTASDVVFCPDGETVQQKLSKAETTLDNITGVSDSTELDDGTKLATSKAVNALRENVNSSLIDSNTSESFNFGSLNGVRGFFTSPSRADDSFIPFKSGILIPQLSFSISCSASSVMGTGSSISSNTINVSSSCSSEFTFSIESYSKLSIESGTCSYTLTDSKGIASSKLGTLSADTVVDISDYDTLVLSSEIKANGRQVGTHNANASGSNSTTIINLKME